jgi:hypothetical protein
MLLKDITNKLDIPFLDPSLTLIKHNPSIIYNLSEPDLHHYTDIGHKLIGIEYNKLINNYVFKNVSKDIYN